MKFCYQLDYYKNILVNYIDNIIQERENDK
jgi:hypothetical protein